MLISVGFFCRSAPFGNCHDSGVVWWCGGVGGGGAALKLCGLVYTGDPKCPSVPVSLTSPSFPSFTPFFSKKLTSSSPISLPLLSLPLLLHPLCLSRPFTLPQCPEERGGAFQKPGDHSPLWASGPQSDRWIRIRIDVHSPQCPSDELEGAKTEGAGGRREMKRGSEGVRSHTQSAFPLVIGVPSVFTSRPSVALSSLFNAFWCTYTPHMCMHA